MTFRIEREEHIVVGDRRVRHIPVLVLLLTLASLVGCNGGAGKDRGFTATALQTSVEANDPTQSIPAFRDVTEVAGLNFHQSNGGCGLRYFPEQMAAGAALLDANGDGNLDVYFPQPQPLGECVSRLKGDFNHRLYIGDGKGRFRLAPDAFQGVKTDYGMAGAAGDYDNDGRADLYVSCYGKNKLFHNNGNGTFTDVTKKAGLEVGGFSTGSVWFDYDRDGRLDLYVMRYCEWSVAIDQPCYDPTGRREYCAPAQYVAATNKLFHNNGDGTFSDVTSKSGAAPDKQRSLAAAAVDYDADGRLDLFVANDQGPNFLLRNKGDGTFVDVALKQNVALGITGLKQANMGIAVGDYNDTGRQSFLVTTFTTEPRTLYRNDGPYFTDVSEASGISPATREYLAFGTGFIDSRNIGRLDLFLANGHIYPSAHLKDPPEMYQMPNQLLLNDGAGRFVEAQSSLPENNIRVHRGACFGDFDNDGRVDILVTATGDRPTLLHNETKAGNWLQLKLVDKYGCATPVGTRCTATVNGRKLLRALIGGGSYGGESDTRVHFGLGVATKVSRMEIRWLSGKVQVLKDVAANRILTVTEPSS
jgi:enediyne biosynthesis protein E4